MIECFTFRFDASCACHSAFPFMSYPYR
jgi:hypothetical protein